MAQVGHDARCHWYLLCPAPQTVGSDFAARFAPAEHRSTHRPEPHNHQGSAAPVVATDDVTGPGLATTGGVTGPAPRVDAEFTVGSELSNTPAGTGVDARRKPLLCGATG